MQRMVRITAIKYAKPTKTWNTKMTKNVFSFYDADVLQERDIVDIFHFKAARLLSYMTIE